MNDYYGFIYLWTNTHPDVKKHSKYIGQHIGKDDDGYIGSGILFRRKYKIKKYKKFWVRTILEYCNNINELNEAEYYWTKKYNAVYSEDFCNLTYGGSNSPQHKELVKKRFDSIIKNKNYDKRDQQILDYITKNTWYKLSEHTFLSKRKDANTVKRLRDKKLIKLEYFGVNDVRYVLPNWSLEDQINKFIKNNDKCTKKEVVDFATDRFIITECKVNKLMTKMVKENKIINTRGYRVNLWSTK